MRACQRARIDLARLHMSLGDRLDGLRALLARDRALEAWLLNVVVPTYEAMEADPSRGNPIEKVMADLEARGPRRRRSKPEK